MLAILANSVPRSSALVCAGRLRMTDLNGGPQDVANLTDKLAFVLADRAPGNLLDLCNRPYRTVAVDFVQEQSIARTSVLPRRARVAATTLEAA